MADENSTFLVNFTPEDDSSDLSDAGLIRMEQREIGGTEAFLECASGCSGGAVGSGADVTAGANRYLDCMGRCSDEHCISDDQLIEVLVTKRPADLNYRLETSHGTLGTMTVESENYAESHTIKMKAVLEIPDNLSNASGSWEGNVYNRAGAIMSPPALYWDEDLYQFTWTPEAFGVIRVTGMKNVDIWPIAIPQRNDSTTESAFSATVMAFYNDSVATLEVEEEEPGGPCFGASVVIDPDDPDDPDPDKCYKAIYTINPCTGEQVGEVEMVEMVCPENE